jgi:phosphatidylglycerophosphatase A
MRLSRAIATFGYVGLMRPAPGTWGSLVALPLAWALHVAGGPVALAVAVAVVVAVGWWAVAGEGGADESEFVIDEVAGMWIALLPVSVGAAHAGAGILALWPGWLVAFVAFRLFDTWKPGPIGWADRKRGPMGVMLDDILAGIAAAVCVGAGAAIAHGLMGA